MRKILINSLILCVILLLHGCSPWPGDDTQLSGTVLIWHDWSEQETQTLNQLLQEFMTVYPEVTVVQVQPQTDDLREAFINQTTAGLGPDLLFGSSDWTREFVEQGLIRPINLQAQNIDPTIYFSAALATLRVNDQLYGLPLSLNTQALYFNRNTVKEPAADLQTLLRQATEGRRIAINSGFEQAFWGVSAFGGRLFNEQGQVVLDEGGFASWLGWLKSTQDIPTVILDNNTETLRELFLNGEVDYYVGRPSSYRQFQEALGEDAVGVTTLPNGPGGTAGPFLRTEALMFNRHSSPQQHRLAVRLAQYLTNEQQQTTLMRVTNRVPTNINVRINPRLYPLVAAFSTQARTAVPMPNTQNMVLVRQLGSEAYVQALSGVEASSQIANAITQRLNSQLNLTATMTTTVTQSQCPTELSGRLRLWHQWGTKGDSTLREVAHQFNVLCPAISVGIIPISSEQLLERYRDAVSQGRGPELMIGSSKWVNQLAAENQIRSLETMVQAATLQRYLPAAQNALRYEAQLYGLPVVLEVPALYYKTDQVDEPARSMDVLLSQATPEQQVALLLRAQDSFWAIWAFGGITFDEQFNLRLSLEGFTNWLSWLQQAAQKGDSIILTRDPESLKEQFLKDSVVYMTGGPAMLNELQATLGVEQVGVVPLPAGPVSEAQPFITAKGLLFNPNMSEEQAQLSLVFARFLTDLQNQTLLMEQSQQVPANVNVNTTNYPAINGFLRQTEVAHATLQGAEAQRLWALTDNIYTALLTGSTMDYLRSLSSELVALVNGEQPLGQQTAVPSELCAAPCEVLLWHSWSETETAAFERVVLTRFTTLYPNVRVRLRFIPTERMAEELTATIGNLETSDSGPEIFVASHIIVPQLNQNRLIQEVTPLVKQGVYYTAKAILALRNNENRLFGIPFQLRMNGFYYNSSMVSTPPRRLTTLEAAIKPETPFAFDSSFRGAFWGVAAFAPPETELLNFDEQGRVVIHKDSFVSWLRWLQNKALTVDGSTLQPVLLFDPNQAQVEQKFTSQQAAFLTTQAHRLRLLEASMGANTIEMAPFPSGTLGRSRPWLEVEAFFINRLANEEMTQVAVALAEFAATQESQTRLLGELGIVPVNLTVDTRDYPKVQHFIELSQYAYLAPKTTRIEALLQAGNQMYRTVLLDGIEPETAVDTFLEGLNSEEE